MKKQDRLCIRVKPQTAERLVVAAAEKQLEDKKITSVSEYIVEMLMDRYNMETEGRRGQQPNKLDQVTFLPVLPDGLRQRMDAERERVKKESGKELSYNEIILAELNRRTKLDG